MAHHHASPYHEVKHVPMIVSPLFQAPVPRYHDFSLEHRIVQEYQRIMAEEAAVMEAKENAYKLYSEERQARLEQERVTQARKIAPGFLDNEDRRILTPTLVTAQAATSAQESSSKAKAARNLHFDYSEFEAKDSPVEEALESSSSKVQEAANANQTQGDTQRGSSSTPSQDVYQQNNQDNAEEEEVIVQAVPLSELTGLLRDSCLEEESSSSLPQSWSGRDAASELTKEMLRQKSVLPSFSATRLDFREFEQGLGPPDPWETPVDDLTALRDVISQQMGHNNSSQSQDIAQGRPQPLQQLQQQQSQTYPYQPQQTPSPFPQHADQHSHNQYQFGTPPTKSGYNPSPTPVAAFVPQPKVTGIAQQQQTLQYHQQQHRHSTGGIAGAHPASTGLTAAQQHARFGNASPSPPPLPPPPRAMTSSPSVGTGSAATINSTSGSGRPPVPARPHRPTDQSSLDSPASAGIDHTTVLDRSMTPPRPPLPPPPPSSQVAAGAASSASSSVVGPSGPTAGPPALKPRPPKDHEMLHGMLGPGKTPAPAHNNGFGTEAMPSTGSSSSVSASRDLGMSGDDHRHQQQVAPAPPNANSLIEQLVNMGFTREQSRSALEKYDYDLEKATNHLLDWDE
ncbi:hypothetical protein BGZ54_006612 [Gamsiella multidivaricata]|nr:hypothetical protein BGZ54_006612 [Gamsiella multidivaricata]